MIRSRIKRPIDYRRTLRYILRKIISLKTIFFVFIFLFAFDAVLSKILGENYEKSYPPLYWLNILLLFYVIFGFSVHIAKSIEKRRLYYMIGWLVLLFVVLCLILWFVVDKLSSWMLLQNILFVFLIIIFVSGILLLSLQIIKIGKTPAIALFNKIRLHKIAFSISIIFLVFLFVVYYGNTKIQILNDRLATIEN